MTLITRRMILIGLFLSALAIFFAILKPSFFAVPSNYLKPFHQFAYGAKIGTIRTNICVA